MNNQIVKLIKKRLVKGEKRYDKENIMSDGRDFVEEALDCAVYLAGHLIEIKEKNNKFPESQCTGDECI